MFIDQKSAPILRFRSRSRRRNKDELSRLPDDFSPLCAVDRSSAIKKKKKKCVYKNLKGGGGGRILSEFFFRQEVYFSFQCMYIEI